MEAIGPLLVLVVQLIRIAVVFLGVPLIIAWIVEAGMTAIRRSTKMSVPRLLVIFGVLAVAWWFIAPGLGVGEGWGTA